MCVCGGGGWGGPIIVEGAGPIYPLSPLLIHPPPTFSFNFSVKQYKSRSQMTKMKGWWVLLGLGAL